MKNNLELSDHLKKEFVITFDDLISQYCEDYPTLKDYEEVGEISFVSCEEISDRDFEEAKSRALDDFIDNFDNFNFDHSLIEEEDENYEILKERVIEYVKTI